MSTHLDRIHLDPEICHGKPTVRGLRYPAEMIQDLLSAGDEPRRDPLRLSRSRT
jgi:uncharacterized protein (DUF433 family)